MAEEKEALMSYTGLEEEAERGNSRGKYGAKFCQWGNPKFWQLLMSDLPLFFCTPAAAVMGLIDYQLLAVTMLITSIDIINMLTYLMH